MEEDELSDEADEIIDDIITSIEKGTYEEK
jgi:hypothetical protein